MIEVKDVNEWQPKSVTYEEYVDNIPGKIEKNKPDPEEDYLLTRRMVADNFETWTVGQKMAIVRALFDQGMASNNGDGGVIA